MHWGDLATWVGAIGSIGALSAAIIAALQARKIYLLESERDRLAEQSRQDELAEFKKRQASRISSWLSLREIPDQSDKAFLVIVVRNASELPVYSVAVQVLDSSGNGLVSERLEVLPPADSPLELPQVAFCEDRFSKGLNSTEGLAVRIAFRDSSGTEWVRSESGALVEKEGVLTSSPRAGLLPSGKNERVIDTE